MAIGEAGHLPGWRLGGVLLCLDDQPAAIVRGGSEVQQRGEVQVAVAGHGEHAVAHPLFIVGHDLTATTRAALVDGTLDMLLSIPRRELAERTVSAMVEALQSPLPDVGSRQIILPIDIFTPESV